MLETTHVYLLVESVCTFKCCAVLVGVRKVTSSLLNVFTFIIKKVSLFFSTPYFIYCPVNIVQNPLLGTDGTDR